MDNAKFDSVTEAILAQQRRVDAVRIELAEARKNGATAETIRWLERKLEREENFGD